MAGLKGLRLPVGKLQEYDTRVVGYETRLAKARGGFAFKYFQYLSLLYAEVFLDRLTEDPPGLSSGIECIPGCASCA